MGNGERSPGGVDRSAPQQGQQETGPEFPALIGFSAAIVDREIAEAESVAAERRKAVEQRLLFEHDVERAVLEAAFLIGAAAAEVQVERAFGGQALPGGDFPFLDDREQQRERRIELADDFVEQERVRRDRGLRRLGQLERSDRVFGLLNLLRRRRCDGRRFFERQGSRRCREIAVLDGCVGVNTGMVR